MINHLIKGLPFQAFKWRAYKHAIEKTRSHDNIVEVKANGFTFEVRSGDGAGAHLIVTGEWEPYVIRTMERILKPGDTFIDVGANFGYHSVVASRMLHSNGRVLAFECSPDAFPLLSANIHRHNHLSRVELFRFALADREGDVTFYLSNDSGRSSLDPLEDTRKTIVPVRAYDDLHRADIVKLVKIDVEGAELRVLRGMTKLLDTQRPYVIAEVSPEYEGRGADKTKDILEFMARKGYTAEIIPQLCPYPPFDNLPEVFEPATVESITHQCDVLFSPADPIAARSRV